MKTKVNIWVTLIGLLIGALLYWQTPYNEMNLLDLNMWLLAGASSLIGALLSTLIFNEKSWRMVLFITLGVVIAILIRIIYETIVIDSTSHNLAPFELIFGALQTFPMAFFGVYLGRQILMHK